MTPEDRQTNNALSFLDPMLTAGGFKLRPISYFSINAMRTLGLKIGRGKEATEALSPSEMADQLHTLLFIQAADLGAVSRAVRGFVAASKNENEAAAWEVLQNDFITPFLADIPPEGIAAVYEQMSSMTEVEAALVEAKAPKDQRPERTDPKL